MSSVADEDVAGYAVSGSSFAHTVTITDDDVPVATVSGPASVSEGGTATYEVTLDRSPSVGVDVDWAVAGTGDDAADAADFDGTLPTGTVRFVSGTTDLTRTFTVTVLPWRTRAFLPVHRAQRH